VRYGIPRSIYPDYQEIRRAGDHIAAWKVECQKNGKLGSYAKGVDVKFTPDQKAFVRHAMENGRLRHEEDQAEAGIWLRIARDSGNVDLDTRVVENIIECCWLLARYPFIGLRHDDLRLGLRSFQADVIIHRTLAGC
jgi:hypothetical protein